MDNISQTNSEYERSLQPTRGGFCAKLCYCMGCASNDSIKPAPTPLDAERDREKEIKSLREKLYKLEEKQKKYEENTRKIEKKLRKREEELAKRDQELKKKELALQAREAELGKNNNDKRSALLSEAVRLAKKKAQQRNPRPWRRNWNNPHLQPAYHIMLKLDHIKELKDKRH